jgi:hypothetical protein
MIHFGATRVKRIIGCLSFIQDVLSQPLVTSNDYLVFEPQRPFVILMKTANLGITLGQHSLYVGHTNILLLSLNDFPSQGWSEGQIEERYIWRYLDAGIFSGAGN